MGISVLSYIRSSGMCLSRLEYVNRYIQAMQENVLNIMVESIAENSKESDNKQNSKFQTHLRDLAVYLNSRWGSNLANLARCQGEKTSRVSNDRVSHSRILLPNYQMSPEELPK